MDAQLNPVETANAHENFAGVAVAERQAGVGDEVREAIGAAQQATAPIVCKPLLCALLGGLQCQGWRAALLVLRTNITSSAKELHDSIRI